MRLFIAAPLTPELREILCASLARVRAGLSCMPIKWVNPENFHLTFRFLGETPENDVEPITKRLRGVCLGFGPEDVQLGGLGCFPDFSSPKVIWVGLHGTSRLLTLHDAIQKATAGFGAAEDNARAGRRQKFAPHLTVGRVKDVSTKERRQLGHDLSRQTVPNLGAWRIERVILIQSELLPGGSRYRELTWISLSAPERRPAP